jgi:hypothetical protein
MEEKHYKTYKIYTIKDGYVTEGAEISQLSFQNGDKIPALIVGESGRGRKKGVLPVAGIKEGVNDIYLFYASVGKSMSGKPKLFAAEKATETDKVIIVFASPIGFRGGNSHTGDISGDEEVDNLWGGKETRYTYSPFPGEILTEGMIAEGDAGRMGSGKQIIALVPKDKVFRIAYSGRRYGNPYEHFGIWNGKKLTVQTKEEREASELS